MAQVKLPWLAAELGTYTAGTDVDLSGTPANLAPYPARTFAAAVADADTPFADGDLLQALIVKNATNWISYTNLVYNAGTPDKISFASALKLGSQGIIDPADQVTVFAQTLDFWRDESTVKDWGLTRQDLGSVGGGTTIVELDNGHAITGTMTGVQTFNFVSTAGHDSTPWVFALGTGGFGPIFQFNGSPVALPADYNVADNATYIFSFDKLGAGAYVTERKMA